MLACTVERHFDYLWRHDCAVAANADAGEHPQLTLTVRTRVRPHFLSETNNRFGKSSKIIQFFQAIERLKLRRASETLSDSKRL